MKKEKIYILLAGCLFLAGLTLASCTTYEGPPPVEGNIPDAGASTIPVRKVLWINIDGGVGEVVKNELPNLPNIRAILPKSVYSWDGLSDYRTLEYVSEEDPVTWTTMLTGVISEKHHIVDNSYVPDVPIDLENMGAEVTQFPNLFYYLNNGGYKTCAVTPWPRLNNNMLNNTHKTVTSQGDEDTREIAQKMLQNENYAFTLVSFRAALDAGKNGGFTNSNPSYIQALQSIDTHIGELLETLTERENYYMEDWLVIISSNHGGDETGNFNNSSEKQRNTFAIFHYRGYTETELQSEQLYAAYFDQTITGTVIDSVTQYYNSRQNNQFSVEFILRMGTKADGTYDNGSQYGHIMGKRKWRFHMQHNTTFSVYFLNDASNTTQLNHGNLFKDVQWHSSGWGLDSGSQGNGGTAWMFYDGEKKSDGVTTVAGADNDPTNFYVGWSPDDRREVKMPFHVAEIRIWRTLLDQETFIQNGSIANISESHPDYPHLIGCWRFSPDALINETTIMNQVPGMPELTMSEPVRIVKFANTLPKCRGTEYMTIENISYLPQILYWLGISRSSTLDSFVLLHNYYIAEEWRDYEQEE